LQVSCSCKNCIIPSFSGEAKGGCGGSIVLRATRGICENPLRNCGYSLHSMTSILSWISRPSCKKVTIFHIILKSQQLRRRLFDFAQIWLQKGHKNLLNFARFLLRQPRNKTTPLYFPTWRDNLQYCRRFTTITIIYYLLFTILSYYRKPRGNRQPAKLHPNAQTSVKFKKFSEATPQAFVDPTPTSHFKTLASRQLPLDNIAYNPMYYLQSAYSQCPLRLF